MQSVATSFSDALKAPVALAEGTAVVLLKPLGHAAVVEGVVTLAPDDHTVVLFATGGLRLAPVAGVWNMRGRSGLVGRPPTDTGSRRLEHRADGAG